MQLIPERSWPARLALIAGLILLLAACGSTTPPVVDETPPPVEDGTPGGDDSPPAADEVAPQVFISSGPHSTTATYELRGVAVDNIGIAAASYELNGAAGADLAVAEAGSFSAELVLVPGSNDIRVSVSDEAGNEASAVATVTYVPQIGGVSASAMVVQAGSPLTLHGGNFGSEPGTVMIGGTEAQVLDWAAGAITVTVPAGVGGWADVEISAGSTFVLEDLFVGIELTDPDLSGAIIGAGIEPGTAILLSGSEYTLTQLPVEDPANFLVPLSFYGAPTDGSPLTRITPSDGMLLFSTGAGFGVQFQDLEIRAHAVRFANATTELIAPSQLVPDSGLHLRNVHFVGQEALALSANAFSVTVGLRSEMNSAHPVRSPRQVQLEGVHVSRFRSLAVFGLDVNVTGSDFSVANEFTFDAIQGRLDISESVMTGLGFGSDVPSLGFAWLHGHRGTALTGNEIRIGTGVLMFGGLMDPQADIVVSDNDFELTQLTVGLNGQSAEFARNVISGGIFGLAHIGPAGSVRDNLFDTDQLNINSGNGHLSVQGNEIHVRDNFDLLIDSNGESILFGGNSLHGGASSRVRFAGHGTLNVTDNDFEFAEAAETGAGFIVNPTWPVRPLELRFAGNQVSGLREAFLFQNEGPGVHELQVEITDNAFSFEPDYGAGIMTFWNIRTPSLVTVTDDSWGDVTDPADFLGRVTFVDSDPEVLVLAFLGSGPQPPAMATRNASP